MAQGSKYKQKRAEAIAPYLEPGEEVRESFLGQTPVPPWVFFLIASYVFIFMQKYRTVAATDRHVYVLHNKWLRSYKFESVAHKVPIGSAQIESGSSWLKIDGGTKLWVPPFGPIKRSMNELLSFVRGTAALPAAADGEPAPEPSAPPAASQAPAPSEPPAGEPKTPPQGTPPVQ